MSDFGGDKCFWEATCRWECEVYRAARALIDRRGIQEENQIGAVSCLCDHYNYHQLQLIKVFNLPAVAAAERQGWAMYGSRDDLIGS